MLSTGVADKLNVKPGDMLELYFIEPGSVLPRIRKVKLAGTYHTGMEEIDKSYALCDLRLLQRVNGWDANKINGYQMQLDDDAKADTVANTVFYNYVQPPLTTYTMEDIFPNLFDWLHLQDVNTRVIIGIMAIVAIINLAAALLILIVEQVRMVGVLKAQGMPNGQIQRIFLYHAAIISGMGIVLGNILAFGICWLQIKTGFLKLTEANYALRYVPVKLYWWQPVLINGATIVLCILCMWLPSLYIRRIHPARVLQFK
jgi:lipoprotein-releasing system permease protein